MKATIVKIDGNEIEFKPDGVDEVVRLPLAEHVKPSYVKMGKAEVKETAGLVTFCQMEVREPQAQVQSTIGQPKSDIVNISGKDFMTYEGLLKKAHEKDPNFSMVIRESFVSEDMKRAWCKVRLGSGPEGSRQIFDGFGSSTPENTGSMTMSHPVEMSHTRAKGRALRDFLNIGVAMAEEIKQ